MDQTGSPNPLQPIEEHRAWKDRLATWAAYAAAAGATMAAAGNAEAGIIYVHPSSPIELMLPGAAPYTQNTRLTAPVTIDGVLFGASLQFERGTPVLTSNANIANFFYPGSLLSTQMKWFDSGKFLVDFAPGQAVGGTDLHRFGRLFAKSSGAGTLNGGGNFPLNETGFGGFQLPTSAGGGMGWIRTELIDRDGNGRPDELEIIDWAYNDAGGGISAGEESAAPEPASAALALFALGAAGLMAWRRRRAAAS